MPVTALKSKRQPTHKLKGVISASSPRLINAVMRLGLIEPVVFCRRPYGQQSAIPEAECVRVKAANS